MKNLFSFVLVIVIVCSSAIVTAEIPQFGSAIIYARSGVTGFNLPNGSSLSSTTIDFDDNRDVSVDVNFVGGTGSAGLFNATNDAGTVTGGIVFDAGDIILSGPSLNGQQQTILGVGVDLDLFLYDANLETTTPLNVPLGVSAIASLTHDSVQNIGGRLKFGFNGSVYGTFPTQSSGIPSVQVYAADSDVDSSSPYSFLYTPGVSQGTSTTPPRIVAKVSTIAGFDFEEIRIFDADGTSTLIAVETETDPASPFTEFGVNRVSISDDGSKVAFQADDLAGDSGIYLYDDDTQVISKIASESMSSISSIDFFAPDVNNQGTVVFRGYDQKNRSSVFVGDGTDLSRLGGEGDTIATDIGLRQLGRRDLDSSQSGAPGVNNNGDVGMIFQYYNPDNSGSVADGHLIMLFESEPTSTTIAPTSVVVTSGVLAQGGPTELAASDDLDLSARRSNSDVQSRVFIEVKGISPTTAPSSMEFVLEGSVFARTPVVQSIEFWNYTTEQWEEFDSRDAARFSDQTVTVVPTGDLSRFVELSTSCTEARIRFQSTRARQRFAANIDLTSWTFQN